MHVVPSDWLRAATIGGDIDVHLGLWRRRGQVVARSGDCVRLGGDEAGTSLAYNVGSHAICGGWNRRGDDGRVDGRGGNGGERRSEVNGNGSCRGHDGRAICCRLGVVTDVAKHV